MCIRDSSPVIQDLDNGLAAVRRSIIASLNSHISTLEIQLETMRKEEAQVNRRISTMPSQEKVMLDIMRQQKIQQNDVIYVKPNKYKAQTGEISQNRNFYLSLASTAISVATLIVTLTKVK